MESTSPLVRLLQKSELVQKTIQLKKIIENDPRYDERFHALLNFQKEMVRSDQAGRLKDFERAKAEYENGMAELTAFPVVVEYLNCIEELQDLMRDVSQILQNGILDSEESR